MSQESLTLIVLAATVGFLHTLAGPDHYLPFVVMARSRRWSQAKTAWVTVVCGFGHLLGSVVLGGIGIALGLGVGSLEVVESSRDKMAAWLMIAFGLVYLAWGLRRTLREQPHGHWHVHRKTFRFHKHANTGTHDHSERADLTPWLLFLIFIFGPCEPLIPFLIYPAAKGNLWELALVVCVFGMVTLGTMVAVTLMALRGLRLLPVPCLERYAHPLAGATICLCGLAIQLS